MKTNKNLKWLNISGSAWDVGAKLGEAGKEDVWEFLLKSDLWKEVISHKNSKVMEQLHANTKEKFPLIYEELQGLAFGLDLSFKDVFAWNCRGDVLADTNDGCTTVQVPDITNCLAHNEDGFPFFLKKCFIADVSIPNHTSFISFCYPGSIPGHTFAVNEKGLVQTVNNLRLQDVEPELPRMVLGRAILNSECLDTAIDLLKQNSNTGGFNFSLASSQDSRLVSVEFGGGDIGVEEIETTSLHANHAIYLPLSEKSQIITDSSNDRQKRFTDISKENKEFKPFEILRDTKGNGLPIYRIDLDDPDNENTVASAIFKISKNSVEYSFYESSSLIPCYNGVI